MLSILIPTYNYNVYPLVDNLVNRAIKANIIFEIIVIDDGSSSNLNTSNRNINLLVNCTFIERQTNKGRTQTRQELAEKAQYDWLLFLDADVMPKNNDFLMQYISFTNKSYKAIFGGFAYHEDNYSLDKSLRYTFGKHREEIKAEVRNKHPYKVIISSNFMINKTAFLNLNKFLLKHAYGMDYSFGAALKDKQVPVLHIDNQVYHLQIDTNSDFLKKTQNALQTLKAHKEFDKLKQSDISLLKAYHKIKKLGISKLFGFILKAINKPIEKHLTSSKLPSLFIFDIYRLGYFCRIKRNS